MKFYEDLLEVTQKENDNNDNLFDFILDAIASHKRTPLYQEAVTAYEYFKKRNVTITKYQKLLYTLSGEAVPDNYSANYKFTNAFFPIFVKQENAFLLGNGVTFNEDETKEVLGGNKFDKQLYFAGEYALWGAVSFLFFNLDHIDVFKVTEFVPLIGEEDGALHAGIRFWQIDSQRPLRATLYEEDGYTEFIWDDKETDAAGNVTKLKGRILKDKQAYKQIVSVSEADGTEILDGKNYPSFPIVPLWANMEHQSELTGLREKIDGYDLIQSGFANDLDDASQIYWIIQNAGGMDEVDLKKFMDQIKRVKAAVVEDDAAKAEAHTIELPYQARQAALSDLRDSLYRDAMALDTDKISAGGNVTATAIESAYENLELKCDGYEYCVTEAIDSILKLAGVEDSPTYHRRKTTNQPEVTNMVLSTGEYLDDESMLKHLPFLNIDEVDEILERKDAEEMARYEEDEDYGNGYDSMTDGEVVDMAEDMKGKALNGAQTQSLILIMDKFASGGLTEQQAINMISTAIGISKSDARKIVLGEEDDDDDDDKELNSMIDELESLVAQL